MFAPKPGLIVDVGPDATVVLCHRVFMAKGLGQVWHTRNEDHPQTYVVSRWDVHGTLRWSIVEDIEELATYFRIRLRDGGTDVWTPDGNSTWEGPSINSMVSLTQFLNTLFQREGDK